MNPDPTRGLAGSGSDCGLSGRSAESGQVNFLEIRRSEPTFQAKYRPHAIRIVTGFSRAAARPGAAGFGRRCCWHCYRRSFPNRAGLVAVYLTVC
jgi:hypothetical protein